MERKGETLLKNDKTLLRVAETGRGAEEFPSITAHASVVLVCYPSDAQIKQGCEASLKRLRGCGLNVIYLENKTPEQIEKSLANVPANTNIIVDSHGVDSTMTTEKSPGFFLVVPKEIGIDPAEVDLALFEPGTKKPLALNILSGKQVLKALDSGVRPIEGLTPSKWFSACQASGVVDPSGKSRIGCSSQNNEIAMTNEKGEEIFERAMVELLCRPELFDKYDKKKDGVLSQAEFKKYLSKELPTLVDAEFKEVSMQQTAELGGFSVFKTAPHPSGPPNVPHQASGPLHQSH